MNAIRSEAAGAGAPWAIGTFSFSKVNDPKGIRTPVNRRLAEHEAAPIKDADEGAVAVALAAIEFPP